MLMVASSECDADMLYAVRLFAPDPIIWLRVNGKCHIVVHDLEVERARREARHCRIICLTQCWNRLRKEGVRNYTDLAQVIRLVLKEKGLKKITVPPQFPLGLARRLKPLGIKLKVAKNGAFPHRARKSPEEIAKISAAQLMAEVGLSEAVQALKASRITKGNQLVLRNSPLTSERLRAIIDTAVLQAGGIARNTIVAGGLQACDPHEPGHGPLKANEPIVVDVFPRSQRTGYFGDITRTFVRGRASEAVRGLYAAVVKAQDVAVQTIRRGKTGKEVHEMVAAHFDAADYHTTRENRRLQGFFHGTGHGVGLDLHETPRLNANSTDVLDSGMVVCVEPGLYYPQLGGAVRLEDVVHVTTGRPKTLTKFEKALEI